MISADNRIPPKPFPLIAKHVNDVREPVAVITLGDMLKLASSRSWPGTVTHAPSRVVGSKFVEVECTFLVRAIVSPDDLLRMQTLLKLRGEV